MSSPSVIAATYRVDPHAAGELQRLARWAVEHGTAAARGRTVEDLVARLADLWELTVGDAAAEPVPAKIVLAWLPVVVAATDLDDYQWSCAVVRDFAAVPARTGLGWRWMAVGPEGALCFVAGLTVDEAETRRAVGTLNEAELRILAALRGYHLP